MSSKQLVTGSILTTLTLVILYTTLLIPTNTLTLLTLASITVPIALIKENTQTAILVYITSSILGVILLPLNISLLYFLFFGMYGLVKHFIERLHRFSFEWILKLIFFNMIFIIGYTLFEKLISPGILDKLLLVIHSFLPNSNFSSFAIVFLLAQVFFILYDYALTCLIDYYYTYLDRYF